jgi:hypothetical protein
MRLRIIGGPTTIATTVVVAIPAATTARIVTINRNPTP